jgi:MipA family protein
MRAVLITVLLALPLLGHGEENPTLLGAAVRLRPEYDGSKARRTDVIPVLRYYGQPWFARTTQGVLEAGLRNELAPQFWAGAQLAYEAGREPDLGPGVSAGLHLEWDRNFGPVPVTFLIRARQNLDADRGGQADLRVTAGVLARGPLQAGVFAQATWGSEAAVRSLYGPRDSGLLYVSGGVLGSLDLSRHWIAVASLELRSLRDPAEHSALVERRQARYAAAGLAYRF